MGGEGALEAAALGGGADQAGIGEVAAAEDGFGDLEIQRVQVGQDQVAGAGRGFGRPCRAERW